jgi:hypothetical protein
MSRIDCRGGHTQIAKILAHVRRENDKARIGAWSSSATYATARASSACAMRPLCQEGYDPVCEQAFREIAHLTHGPIAASPQAPPMWVSFCARPRPMPRAE